MICAKERNRNVLDDEKKSNQLEETKRNTFILMLIFGYRLVKKHTIL